MDNRKTNFGKRKIKFTEKTSLVQDVFSKVSKKYDLMNDLMSVGSHRIWKRDLIDIMNFENDEKIIDVGSGTADLVKLILKKNKKLEIYSIDLNKDMLDEGRKKFEKINNIQFIHANAEKLPFKNNFFDKYIISFCLRNITYTEKALEEAIRVLKPGGIFYCLEFSSPTTNIMDLLYSKYKNKIIPFMGKKIAKNEMAYKYLEESIDQFPDQETLIQYMSKVGFENNTFTNLFDGIVCIHKGFKTI